MVTQPNFKKLNSKGIQNTIIFDLLVLQCSPWRELYGLLLNSFKVEERKSCWGFMVPVELSKPEGEGEGEGEGDKQHQLGGYMLRKC